MDGEAFELAHLVAEAGFHACVGIDGSGEHFGGGGRGGAAGDAEDGVARFSPEAQARGDFAGAFSLGETTCGGVELHGEVHHRDGGEDRGLAVGVDLVAEERDAGFGRGGEEARLDFPHHLFAGLADELGDELLCDLGGVVLCGLHVRAGGGGELGDLGVEASEGGADAIDEEFGGSGVHRGGVGAFDSLLDPCDCVTVLERFALDDAADFGRELVEFAGSPCLSAEDEGCLVAWGFGVAFEEGARVFADELLGVVDDDELVLLHEAEASALVEDVGGGGLLAIEVEGLDLALFGADCGFELLGEFGDEEAFFAVEDGDSPVGGGGLRFGGGALGHVLSLSLLARLDVGWSRWGSFHVQYGVLILTVIEGPDAGKRFEMPPNEPQLIGRSSEALPMTDNTVSRRHAELTPDDGQWFVRDLKSQNGTYVNGSQITSRRMLKDGDEIRVGSTLLRYGTPPADAATDVIHILHSDQIDAEVEHTLASNEDSVLLAEPEPRRAAVDHLRVIYQLTTLTAQVLDPVQLLNSVMDLIFDEFEPERGFIMLVEGTSPDGKSGDLVPAVVRYRSVPVDKEDAKIHVSRTILQHAIKHAEGVLSSNAMNDPRFAAGDSVQRYRIRSAICSPIRFRDRVFGAIYIDSSIANYTFTSDQLALMNAIGQHTGLALASAEAYTNKLQTERLAAMGQAIASLSHSIKNILQGLRGGADVVEMGLNRDDLKIASGGWGILKRNLDRIMGLTLNMLAYSRQRSVDIELVKIGALIEDCNQLLDQQLQAKQVAMIVDVDSEMPPVPIDPNLMHQALMNILGNAVEAVEPGKGAITVRAAYHQPTKRRPIAVAEIAIIDNGPGIPEEKRTWIFEPFNTTKGTRGTGLGLAVAKRIVEDHRGRIRLETDKGKGATFRILLPADTIDALDPAATASTQAEGPGTL